MTSPIQKIVLINAGVSAVWHTLTNPASMRQWMGEPEMELEIHTNWQVNSPLSIHGFHHIKFETKGTVLQYEPNKRLRYIHLSSTSRLPDQPHNYSVIEFLLTPLENQTELSVTITQFPTETIFKHLAFYWGATIYKLKAMIEKESTLPVADNKSAAQD